MKRSRPVPRVWGVSERGWGEREWAGRARLGRVGGGVAARAPWSWAAVLGAVKGGGDSRVGLPTGFGFGFFLYFFS